MPDPNNLQVKTQGFALKKLKYLLYRYIGGLDESCLKHRSAILFISAIILFVDPEISITFSGASLAGLGITVDPPQTLPVGLLLLAILTYRLIALWISAIINSGTNLEKTTTRLRLEYDPSYDDPASISEHISLDAQNSVYHWETRKALWEFLVPNLAAFFCFTKYAAHYI